MSIRVEHGDSREVLKSLADESIHACVTDPPYSLVSIQKRFGKSGQAEAKFGADGLYQRASRGFMGTTWDTGETAFDPAFWREVLRVLKPGAHLIAFSGTRTYHRMTCAIEDAGFEVRDQIGWAFGSGFPKSHNIGGGWGTALKPAWEPICVARKPLSEKTVAANVQKHGTAALNIDACRVAANDLPEGRARHGGGIPGNGTSFELPGSTGALPSARWPANLCHDGSEEVIAAFPEADGAVSNGRGGVGGLHEYGMKATAQQPGRADHGSAARFFYSAKADASDRLGSKHPTVKPVDLMRWLVRLVTPPNGTVLDPFAGTGTTGMACMAEGFDCILIEREAEYVKDIKNRIAHVSGENAPLFSREII